MIVGMAGNNRDEENPFEKAFRQFEKENASAFSKFAEAITAASAPAMRQFTERLNRRMIESGQIDLSGFFDAIPQLDLAEELSYLQSEETTKALNEISRRFADSVRIDPEIIERLEKEFRDNPPSGWAEAAERAGEDEAVQEAAQEFKEQHPEDAEAIRTSLLDIAKRTPYDVSETGILWGLVTLGVAAGATAGTVAGIPTYLVTLIAILIRVMEYPRD